MTEPDLLQALARGEDSRQQFKRYATHAGGMAAERAALANCGGGRVFWGVADLGGFAWRHRCTQVLVQQAKSQIPIRTKANHEAPKAVF